MIETTRKCDGSCGDNSPHDSHLTDAGKASLSFGPALFDSVPVTLEAMCWVGGPQAATTVINWILENDGTASWMEAHELGRRGDTGHVDVPEAITIRTLEGNMRANPGDWIIRGTEGEFYPCKPSVFERKYKNHVVQENKEKD